VVSSAHLNIRLEADVEQHDAGEFYTVKNIRVPGPNTRDVLPNVQIEKRNGLWIHTDSHKESHLSQAIGHAIDMIKERLSQ
jgi:hypothetical protein